MSEELALFGGPKAVTVQPKEMWAPPLEDMLASIRERLYGGRLSGDWEKTYFQFEPGVKAYLGSRYCAALNCGTAALWSAYAAVGIKPGDEVLCPSYTWISTIAPALYMGAVPVLCETERDSVLVDPQDIRRKITGKSKAIVVTHMFGNVVDMDAVMEISGKYGIPVIEDASHAHGAEWKGRKVGTIGQIGCFSMQGDYNGKPIPAGEGGFVVTDDRELFNRIILHTHLNRPNNPGDELYPELLARFGKERLGMKYRAHPFALVIATHMLQSLDYRNERKSAYRNKLVGALSGMDGIKALRQHEGSKPAGYFGGMQLLYDREALRGVPFYRVHEAVEAEGVSLKYRFYTPLHLYQLLQDGFDLPGVDRGIAAPDYKGVSRTDFPVTNQVVEGMLGMPVFVEEPQGYSDQVIRAFGKVLSSLDRLRSAS